MGLIYLLQCRLSELIGIEKGHLIKLFGQLNMHAIIIIKYCN